MIKKAMTHAGSFHADDVFSAAILKMLNRDIIIERVFNVPDDYDGLVFDIGGGKYDHHQPNAEFRENGVKYAAFGLLWRDFGEKFMSKEDALKFDEYFIQSLDTMDNFGASDVPNQFSFVISSMNCLWNEENQDTDAKFFKAVDWIIFFLESKFAQINANTEAKAYVDKAFEESDGKIVILDRHLPWRDFLISTSAVFVVYPSNRGGYNAQVVPISEETVEAKVDFNEEWAGLRNEELEKVSGIKGLSFCHSSLFLCAGTKEAVLEACKVSLKRKEELKC